MDDLAKSLDEENIRLTVHDILHAIKETVAAFGVSMDDLEQCRFITASGTTLRDLACISMLDSSSYLDLSGVTVALILQSACSKLRPGGL